ncbi:unnamed protein product [Phytophthora lilii]|uniref:Unnamed protein product n=1 Tax=Phytophthora lilii TaxID=2077276 RepID=A0A9W6TCY5_9STRA|nr:unnamed protein product [Phytophthora lilii]
MWGFYFKNASMIRYNWIHYRTAPTYEYLKEFVDRFERRTAGSAFVQTSNVDGLFAQEGFDPKSVYVMQGDCGRIQCAKRCSHQSVVGHHAVHAGGTQSFNPMTYRIEDPAGVPKMP